MKDSIRLIEYGALTSSVGGVEVYIKNQLESMAKEIRMDFLVPNEPEPLAFEDFLTARGCTIYRCYRRWKNSFLGHYVDLFRFFFKHHSDYDIAVANILDYQNINFLIVAKLFGIKTIAHAHSAHADRSWKYRLLVQMNRVLSRFFIDVFFSCSEDAAKWMFGPSLWKNKPSYLVRNRIDLSLYQKNPEKREEKRGLLKAEEQTLVIGHTGRLAPGKNHEFMLHILKEILTQKKEVILLFLGDGELLESLEHLADELGVSSFVRFMGRRSDVADWLQAMDVFLFPSDHEGLPLSLIEAQAAGLPCVISDAVPKESGITPICRFLSLEEPLDEWAGAVLAAGGCGHQDYRELLRKSGYDMADNEAASLQLYQRVLMGDTDRG